jgi:polysaccharide transporter, PST family
MRAGWGWCKSSITYFPLMTLFVVTRAFGPDVFGIVSILNAYGLYAGVVANYGLSITGPRSIARLCEDQGLLSKTISAFLATQCLLGAVAVLVLFAAFSLIPHVKEYRLVSLIIRVQMFATAPAPQWVYVGLEHARDFALKQFVFRGLAAVFILLLIRTPQDLLLYVSVNCIAAVAILVSAITGLARYRVEWVAPKIGELVAVVRQSSPIFFSRVSLHIYTAATLPIIAVVLGPGAAGIFALADRIRVVAGSFVEPITDAAYPFLCRIAGREGTMAEVWTKRILFRSVIAASVLIAMGLFIFAPYIISALGGGKFHGAVLVLRAVALLPLFTTISRTFGNQIMLPLQMDREYVSIVTVAALCGVCGIFVLTSEWGLLGAAFALLAVEMCIALSFALVVWRRCGISAVVLRY